MTLAEQKAFFTVAKAFAAAKKAQKSRTIGDWLEVQDLLRQAEAQAGDAADAAPRSSNGEVA